MNYYFDNWINVNSLNIDNIPSDKELNELSVGYSVKISNGKERFWVEVQKVTDYYILGRVDNNLVSNQKYNYNDLILFERSNIFDIHDLEFKKMIVKYVNNKNNIKLSRKKKNI